MLDLKLDRPLAFLDIESTGANPRTDRLIDLAIVKCMPDNTREEHSFRVNPGIPIPPEVTSATGLTVVWGPVELRDWEGISYSRAFVAGDATTGEYFAVIRGTNFESLQSWLKQDFDLDKAVPFGQWPGNPPFIRTAI